MNLATADIELNWINIESELSWHFIVCRIAAAEIEAVL